MERELWPILYDAVVEVSCEVKQVGVHYQPWVIALMILWATLHDRPRRWACDPRNWSTTRKRPIQLPSESVLSRRADSVGMGLFWKRLEEHLRGTKYSGLISIVDGKPLFVGGCSKDRDAHWGYGAGMKGKGYKLHTIWGHEDLPKAWDVTPLNRDESKVAWELLEQVHSGGYLLGDGNYDTGPTHIAATKSEYQMITKDRRPNAGRGHRQVCAPRQRSIQLRHSSFGQELLAQRSQIERDYAHASCFGGGLAPLPSWVRRLSRVRTWVMAKLLINAARIIGNQQLTT